MEHQHVNELQELMVDYMEELYDTSDIITMMEEQPRKVVKKFTKVVEEEYDWYAERQEEHDDRTIKLKELLEALKIILP